ncbi:unnamed protein product [Allacma fusca]|uniref:Uncharacterized protein n=1 Tax=Allacma fusca TaxID=39272 RepID=A0A8J2P282_9HEXA|nr:unnamed protein product [Allacma fusca]
MTADGKLVEDNTSNEALLDAKPRVILKGERQYEPYVPFPFEPKIVTPAPFWQPWCYFMPGMPPKYKRGQYSAKTNFPGKPSGAKTATSPYQQNPQGFYPPTAGYGNGPAGYANYPMYPPPQPQYGKPTGSPYGNAPAGVGMTPLPGGMPYPGYMVPPHLMPTMAPCSCPCPVKVPIRLRNKNDVKVVVRYTAHGPPPCCNCSCCC